MAALKIDFEIRDRVIYSLMQISFFGRLSPPLLVFSLLVSTCLSPEASAPLDNVP